MPIFITLGAGLPYAKELVVDRGTGKLYRKNPPQTYINRGAVLSKFFPGRAFLVSNGTEPSRFHDFQRTLHMGTPSGRCQVPSYEYNPSERRPVK